MDSTRSGEPGSRSRALRWIPPLLLMAGGGAGVVLGLVMGSSWGWGSSQTIHSLLWGTIALFAGISRLPPVRDAEQETEQATGGDELPPQAPEPTRIDPSA